MEFINLHRQYEALKPRIDERMQKVLDSTQFIGGKEVQDLEKVLAEYVGTSYCVTCGNGTDALELAYLAAGVGTGDAVFCPDMTFIASIEPACMLGAHPVFCDIDGDTCNLSPQALETAIKRTVAEGRYLPKAVVMVDFLGNPADIESISQICETYHLFLIEDAAQAIGAIYKGERCGSFGHIATTSFFPSKPLGCYGDGGAVFTDSPEIAEIIASLKVHGKGESKYDNIRIGINSRLDALQAGVLLAKMEVLEEEMETRQRIARRYDRDLEGWVQTPAVVPGNRCAYAQYVLMARDSGEREAIQRHLKEEGIPSLLYYPKPLHKMRAFSGLGYDGEEKGFCQAEKYARCNVGIPFSPYLLEEEQEQVIRSVKHALRR